MADQAENSGPLHAPGAGHLHAPGAGLAAFEARLAQLAEKMREGFPERARELRSAADALGDTEHAAREDIRRYAHKLRGTAGSHGFGALSDAAAKVEAIALGGPPSVVASEARSLADALERALASAPAAIPEPISEVHAKKAPLLSGLRIAAVDDDHSTRRLLTLTLAKVGQAHAVLEAHGQGLLDRLRSESFDVVVVDAMMPEMNGLACLERIASEGLHREGTRYFILSAAAENELSWALPPVLSVGWLRKPFRPRELVDAIAAHLGR
jgi:CheY-like chemotaxis protein/HPt (histidine-containing phosphotransfer) domain-containing protein